MSATKQEATQNPTGRLLLVDDDPSLLRLLSIRLEAAGHNITAVDNAADALTAMRKQVPDLIITDLRMAGMDGLELLKRVQAQHPGLPVMLLTAHGSIPDAVNAVQAGAFCFLTKPVDKDELLERVTAALGQSGSSAVADDWDAELSTRSATMHQLLEDARRVATTNTAVLITGESGSGKEVLARAIHRASNRHNKAFVAINCAALPEDLLESELFGHAKGAFTGATAAHSGLFRAAHGGTLLLDEIGDMPPLLQAKLLRALQEKQVRPVGSTKSEDVDVRVISATHHDLKQAIANGRFREDLYYRLNVVPLRLPPLREKPEDIPLLINNFLRELAERDDQPAKVYAPEAMELMVHQPWPGNIRQLRNVVEQNVALTAGQVIVPDAVRRALGDAAPVPADAVSPSLADTSTTPMPLGPFAECRDAFIRDYLIRLLKSTDGNVSQAARVAERNRTDFYKLLARHEVDPAEFKP